MAIFGYLRAPAQDRASEIQVEALKAAGVQKVFTEKTASSTVKRPQLTRLLAALNEQDVLIVTCLDHLARSTRELLNIAEILRERVVHFRSLQNPWADTTTSQGHLIVTVLHGLAEFERELIRMRTSDGRAKAAARGQHLGRRPILNNHQRQMVLKTLANETATQADLARQYNVSQSTISRLVSTELAGKAIIQQAKPSLDKETRYAARAFVRQLEGKYSVIEVIVFGSRARGDHKPGSDADLAIVLKGKRGDRWAAVRDMARIAFDVMLETGILVEALPLWAEDLQKPETFGNPALIANIQRDGLLL